MTTATQSKTKSKPKTTPADTLESLRDFAQSIGLTDESLGKPIDGLLEQALTEDNPRMYLEVFAPAGGVPVDTDVEQLPPVSNDVAVADLVDEDEIYSFHTHTGMECKIADTIGVNGKQVWAAFQANEIYGQQRGPDGVDVSGRELLRWIREKNIAHRISNGAITYVRECREAQATEAARVEAESQPEPEPKTAVEKGLAQARQWDAEAEDDGASEKKRAMSRYVVAMLRKENPQDGDVSAIADAVHYLGLTSSQVQQDEKTVDAVTALLAQHADRKDAEAALIDANEKRRSLNSRYREMERETRNAAAEASSRFSLAAGAKAKLEQLSKDFPHLFAEDAGGDGLPVLRVID